MRKKFRNEEEKMNVDGVGFYSCLFLAVFFIGLALLLALLGEKGARLISGFNTLPKAKQALYDQQKLVRDQCRLLVIWAIVLGGGALLSFFISQFFGVAALILWLFLSLKEIHWDANTAFEKYKKSPEDRKNG